MKKILRHNAYSARAFINPAPSQYVESAEENELAEFASVVLAETETVWDDLFEQEGLQYEYPYLVLYTDSVQSACGNVTSAVGPFYCPGDVSVYIDLSFYEELKQNFKAPGDFAFAYVIAHEVGHHVQNQLGITDQVMGLRGKLSEKDFSKIRTAGRLFCRSMGSLCGKSKSS